VFCTPSDLDDASGLTKAKEEILSAAEKYMVLWSTTDIAAMAILPMTT
jgi:hypothetical protein